MTHADASNLRPHPSQISRQDRGILSPGILKCVNCETDPRDCLVPLAGSFCGFLTSSPSCLSPWYVFQPVAAAIGTSEEKKAAGL